MKLSPEFKVRTHCTAGHDQAIHGIVTMGMPRCNECHAVAQRKKMHDRPQKIWARGWKGKK